MSHMPYLLFQPFFYRHFFCKCCVPHTRQNAVRLTRNALPQPPAHVYVPGNGPPESLLKSAIGGGADVCIPRSDQDCGNPLDHTSPHNHPPAFFVEAAARAASPIDTLEDDDEEEEGVNLEDMFNNLVGEERSGLDDLSYSSDEDDKDYDDNTEEEACQIQYSDSSNVRHGRRQTNFIPGGPELPSYNGMNEGEKVLTKKECKKEHKAYTDMLRMKRLKDQNDDYKAESFSG